MIRPPTRNRPGRRALRPWKAPSPPLVSVRDEDYYFRLAVELDSFTHSANLEPVFDTALWKIHEKLGDPVSIKKLRRILGTSRDPDVRFLVDTVLASQAKDPFQAAEILAPLLGNTSTQ